VSISTIRDRPMPSGLSHAKMLLAGSFWAGAFGAGALAAEDRSRRRRGEAARQVARELEPVSVFISRKNQRLYVRQAFQPVLEIPVTIQDPDRPIGTYVYTAMERIGRDTDMRWSVVSLDRGHPEGGSVEPQPMSSDPGGAKAALDRIAIPPDTFDRIAGMVSPRSSLIISDETMSSETGNGTEFVVLMSGEPQGGIKTRRRVPEFEVRYERLPHWRSPFAGPYSTR
jgi:hypothetical protein